MLAGGLVLGVQLRRAGGQRGQVGRGEDDVGTSKPASAAYAFSRAVCTLPTDRAEWVSRTLPVLM